MAREFAKAFYKSRAWSECRASYAKSVGGLCEECIKYGMYVPGKVVHHRIKIDERNITNPLITLSWENLKLVCQDCHAKEHKGQAQARYCFDEEGNLSPR